MTDKKHQHGKCKLTGDTGKLVKSHIIPDAFMQRTTDAPFMAIDTVSRPKKMFTGWYDANLVSRVGEDLLEDLDTYAAKVLKGNGLTYSIRRDKKNITDIKGDFSPSTFLSLDKIDTNKFKLFSLSLMWRAATTSLPDFKSIKMSRIDTEDIRYRMLSGDAGPFWQFPSYLSVFCNGQELPKCAPVKSQRSSFVRFFLDGVILYVSSKRSTLKRKEFEPVLIGRKKNSILIPCVSSLDSWHANSSEEFAQQTFLDHGDIFKGFAKSSSNVR